ncbi:MAG: N-acetylmuramoyl-L-alanine amidase [Verrucomicrobiota bacterium JB023]|nr:N-acetylmuramoyl-L-alanine amidase [Verrucomicrobiota bacterium JB023]
MIHKFSLPVITLAVAGFLASGCSTEEEVVGIQSKRPASFYRTESAPRSVSYVSSSSRSGRPGSRSLNSLLSDVRLKRDIISMSTSGRTGRSMSPRYITIHSTQNWSRGADSLRHALALKRSKLGRISWHYTTDDQRAVQHLPTNEQGNHADHNGPGNKYSIGIEMCEHPGCSRAQTLDRTAKLTAYLMVKHNIPLSRVVPHYHWPRWGKNPPNKNCPHFLMTNGRPGAKWQAYLAKVSRYYNEVAGRPGAYASR